MINNNIIINGSVLTLKSIKTVKWMSEETICFTANLILDGKNIGYASNEGHGGCTFCHFNTPADEAKAIAFAKQANVNDFKGWEFMADKGLSIDILVDILIERNDKAKANEKIIKKVKKDMADKVIFVKEGEDPKMGYRILKCGAAGIEKGIIAMQTKYGKVTIFNNAPESVLVSAFCLA
jgi:hypothetical protein